MKLFENIKITDSQLQPIVDWYEKNKIVVKEEDDD